MDDDDDDDEMVHDMAIERPSNLRIPELYTKIYRTVPQVVCALFLFCRVVRHNVEEYRAFCYGKRWNGKHACLNIDLFAQSLRWTREPLALPDTCNMLFDFLVFFAWFFCSSSFFSMIICFFSLFFPSYFHFSVNFLIFAVACRSLPFRPLFGLYLHLIALISIIVTPNWRCCCLLVILIQSRAALCLPTSSAFEHLMLWSNAISGCLASSSPGPPLNCAHFGCFHLRSSSSRPRFH